MPYSLTIEKSGAYVRLFGNCTYADVLGATIEIWEHPSFREMHYEIFDYLDVHSVDFSNYEVVELAARDTAASRMSRRYKMAVVAKHPDVLALSIEYRKVLKDSGFELNVSDSLERARAWVSERNY